MPIRNHSLSSSTIAQDRLAIKSLRDLAGYAPHSPDHSVAALVAQEQALAQAEDELHRARLAFEAARSKVIDESWALHNRALGAKAEVMAQFGPDSQAVAAVGLTRKSQRKRPTRRRVDPTA